jgi:WD40 repeat protein
MSEPTNPPSDRPTRANGNDRLPAPEAPIDPSDQVTAEFAFPSTAERSGEPRPPGPWPDAMPGYEILGVLGRGGMGVVYKAKQTKLNRLVALKMILAGGHADGAALERFRAEAEAEARLQHPNVVQVYEIGEHEGRPFFSLEFIEGGSLAQKLAGAPLPPQEAARLIETLARAIDFAHQRGIVHRDLKPANVLLTADGTPKITDFGLAKHLESDSRHTQSGAAIGTPSYMAPEQAAGHSKDVGPAADIYSLGAILYECLTGRPPFKAATSLETVRQVASEDPVPPTRLQPRTPRDLETICLKCLRKEPQKRYGSASLLAEDLRRFGAGEPIQARPVGAPELAVKWIRRRPAVAALLGALAALTAAALVLLTLAWRSANAGWHRAEEERRHTEDERKKTAEALAIEAALHHKVAEEKRKTEEEKRKTEEEKQKTEEEKQKTEEEKRKTEEEKQKTEDALRKQEQLTRETETARRAEAEQRRLLQRLSVGLLLDHGALLAAQDDPARGLLWTTRGLRLAAKEDAELERAARRNLAGLSAEMPSLRLVVSLGTTIRFAVLSPDGTLLLTCGDRAALWDARTGELVRELKHRGTIRHASFSPDGSRIVTVGTDQTARLWETATGKAVGDALKHPDAVNLVVFADNGKVLATVCADNALRVWDLAAGQTIGEVMPHDGRINGLTVSPDGKTLLSCGTDRTARLWHLTGQPAGKAMEHRGTVFTAQFSPNGKLIATGSSDKTAQLWSATGEPIGEPLRHRDSVYDVAFSPDSRYLLTGSADKTAKVWKTGTGELYRDLQQNGEVLHVAFGREHFLTGGADQTARLFDLTTGRQVGAPLPHQNALRAVGFSADGKTILTRCASGLVRLWDPPRLAQTVRHLTIAQVTSAAFSPDGGLLVQGTNDHRLRLWKIPPDMEPQELREPIEMPGVVRAVAFSRDGKTILTASDRVLQLRSTATGEVRGGAITNDSNVNAAVLSHDGKIILAGGNRTANLYDVESGKRLGKALPHPGSVLSVAISPDGTLAATGGEDGVVRLWDVQTQAALDVRLTHRGDVRALVFSADGKWLLSGSDDRTARLWEVATGRPVTMPLPHRRNVTAVAISPDGKTLLTGSQDGRVQLWDAVTSRPIGTPVSYSAAVRTAAFSSDGRTHLSATPARYLRDVKVPAALEGDAERLTVWAEVLTGLELDEDGTVGVLDGPRWRERRTRLEQLGGPP